MKMLDYQTLLAKASYSCLVLILYRQLGNCLRTTGESYSLKAQHIHKTLYKSMFETYQKNWLLTEAQDSILIWTLGPICGDGIIFA